MSLFLSSLPLWFSVCLVVVIPTLAAMCGSLLTRRFLGLEQLVTNNEVAGFKFAVVGVTYAVLLGFAVIVVWEKYRDAETTAAQESAAAVAVYRLSEGLSAEAGGNVRWHLTGYIQAVVADDWPAMARGRISLRARRAIDGLYSAVLAVNPGTLRESTIMSELVTRIDAIAQARRARLLLAAGVVPGVLWAALLVGSVVTVTFTFFFGSRSVRAQSLMTGMLATVIFLALFVAIEIDHPFTGPVSIGPEAMRGALEVTSPN